MIDLPTLKLALRLDPDATIEDDYLEHLESTAVDTLQRETGRYFGAQVAAAEWVLQGSGTTVLYLPDYASAVSAVASRAYLGAEETAILTGDTDGWALRLEPGQTFGNRLIRKGGNGWDWYTEYVVTAAIGYAAGAEPPIARDIVIKSVDHWYRNRTAVTPEGGTEIPLHLRGQLNLLRRIAV